MTTKKEIDGLISSLRSNGFLAECPHCDDDFKLKDAGLFHLDEFTPDALNVYQEMLQEQKNRRADLKKRKEKIPKKSQVGAKSVNLGFILERIAPSLDGFAFDRNDCRSMFDPIDYMIFEGLSSKGKVSKIIMVDIKSGAARLSVKQREIKQLIEDKKMEFKTYQP